MLIREAAAPIEGRCAARVSTFLPYVVVFLALAGCASTQKSLPANNDEGAGDRKVPVAVQEPSEQLPEGWHSRGIASPGSLPGAMTIAVLDFDVSGVHANDSELNGLSAKAATAQKKKDWGRKLAEYVRSDLSEQPHLKLVDREHLESILAELKISTSNLSDPDTVLRLGKITGANYLIFGLYSVLPGSRQASLTAEMASVETLGQVVAIEHVKGAPEPLSELWQHLSAHFIRSIQEVWSPNRQSRDPKITASQYLDEGLGYSQQRRYADAAASCTRALHLDPSLSEAKDCLEKASEFESRLTDHP